MPDQPGPQLCVETVIFTDNGVLLFRQEDGVWRLPGGGVMHGEMLADAAKRIVRAELGVEVQIENALGYIEYPEAKNVRGLGWNVGIVFAAKVTSGEATGKEFKELPEEMIAEQRTFLMKHV